MSCVCGSTFVFEACDFASGTVRAILHPTSASWQDELNSGGTADLSLATKDLLIRDAWPNLTSVYISRIRGDGASSSNPIAEFGGFIDKVSATESGATKVGVQSMNHYLNNRTIKQTQRFSGVQQTQIGQQLVQLAQSNGVPLFASADASDYPRDREYRGYTRKVIGEAIEDLTQVINGVEWEWEHTRANGKWSSTMVFRDRVGLNRGDSVILRSDLELSAYALEINATNQATWVDAIGSGEEEDQLVATAVDDSGVYPQFDATPAWKDVNRLTTLQSHADGYLDTYQEPTAIPTITVSGIDELIPGTGGRVRIPSPGMIRNGDTIKINQDFGALTYRGQARVISNSWQLSDGAPPSRTYEVLPLTRASESVLNQVPTETCRDC